MKNALNQNIIDVLVKQYQNGFSVKDLVNTYGVCRETIVKYLKLYNVFKPKTHNWTEEMTQKLKEVYPTGNWDLIAEVFPNRSKNELYKKASELNIYMENYYWTEHDKEVLVEYYNKIPIIDLQTMFDQFYTVKAIHSQAKKMGVTKSQCWTDVEMAIMKDNYQSLGAKGISQLLPNKTYDAIIGKAVAMGLRCNCFYTDMEKQYIVEHWNEMSDEAIGKNLCRPTSGIMEQRHKMGLYYNTMERSYYDMTDYIRHNNIDWKRRSMDKCNYQCVLTGSSDFEIHHLYSFNLILKEAMQDDRWINKDIGKYDNVELKYMLDIFYEYQDRYPLGVCVAVEVHRLFHSIYGNKHNTVSQWEEFSRNYKSERHITSITD